MTPYEIKQALDKLIHLLNTSQFFEAESLANILLAQQILQIDLESKAKVFNVLGIVYTKQSDYPQALVYFSKALHINEENGYKEGIARNLGNIGLVYKDTSDYSKAFEYFSKALYINEELGRNTGIATNLGNIGLIYYCLSDYVKALEYYTRALHIDEEIGNNYGIANNFINIGIVYWNISDYPKALEYNFKSLHINEEIGDKHGLATVIGNIANVYNSLSDYPKALEYYSKALLFNEEIVDKNSIARNLGNIGNVYNNLSDYQKALENYENALRINEEIGNKRGIARNFCNIGAVYTKKESSFYNPKNGEEYFQKSLKIAEEIGAKDIVQVTYKLLYSFRQDEKQFEEALEFYKKSIEIEKAIQTEESTNKAQQFDQRRKIEEDEKSRQLKLARFKEQERIFHNILPVTIANRLIEGEQTIAESFENVSIFFSDIVGFTTLSSNIEPAELVKGLNTIFTAFDRIGTKYGLEKIKTIGDAYMAVCGVPEVFEDHTQRATYFALEAIEVIHSLELGKDFKNLQFRIGLHRGSVVAGIIGEKKFAYDVWGDAVNVASRMESNSEPGRIHISEEFAKSIESYAELKLIPRGEIFIKGKGIMKTFWLEKGK